LGGCTEDYANPEGIYKEIQRSLKRFEKKMGMDWKIVNTTA